MTDLETQELVASIKRSQAETDKFVDEGRKLRAEAQKYDRDRVLAPWLASAAVFGGLLELLSFAAHFFGR